MMKRTVVLMGAAVLLLGAVQIFALAGASSPNAPMLTGSVRSAAGEPLGGVPVSARPEGKTYTRTVFTDERGEYSCPPFEAPLAPGRYQVWAQAVGFERKNIDADLPADGARRDLSLTTLKDFSNQLSGGEWLDALPAQTHEDRR